MVTFSSILYFAVIRPEITCYIILNTNTRIHFILWSKEQFDSFWFLFFVFFFIKNYLTTQQNQRNYSVYLVGNYCIVILSRCIFFFFYLPICKICTFASGCALCNNKHQNVVFENVVFTVVVYNFFFVWMRCKDEFDNAENYIGKPRGCNKYNTEKKISLYLWVNRSIGAIHVVMSLIFFLYVCVLFLGWPKCSSCMELAHTHTHTLGRSIYLTVV